MLTKPCLSLWLQRRGHGGRGLKSNRSPGVSRQPPIFGRPYGIGALSRAFSSGWAFEVRNLLHAVAAKINDYRKIASSTPDSKLVCALEPAAYSTNIGDHIISDACRREIADFLPDCQIIFGTTKSKMSSYAAGNAARCALVLACGANLLSSRHIFDRAWQMNFASFAIARRVVTFGVGLSDPATPTLPARTWLRRLLHPRLPHSVRDSRTEAFLRSLGFENVINTACPTMWRLSEDLRLREGLRKSSRCLFTLTDYAKNADHDRKLVDILLRSYRELVFVPQGTGDLRYFRSLSADAEGRIRIGNPSLAFLDSVLSGKDVDYVGTRLHAGIRALQHGVRTIILAVDGRAEAIAADCNLPVLKRSQIKRIEEAVNSRLDIEIRLPVEGIRRWKEEIRGVTYEGADDH